MSRKLKIIIIRAAGYTGASWVNTVIGSHPKALAMCTPNRFWKLGEDMADQACMIHRESCPVWPSLIKSCPSDNDWLVALSHKTGKDVFVLNYPDKHFVESVINKTDADLFYIKLVRDGRASLFSRMRHYYGESDTTAFKNIIEWQIPKWNQIDQKLPLDSKDYFFLRYEDLANSPDEYLTKIGDYIGLEYDVNKTLKFWEHEHHLTSGNVGILDMICRLQGLDGYEHKRKSEYENVIKSVKNGGSGVFIDNSWENGLSHEDKLAFDCLLGRINESYGYSRDHFSDKEKNNFWNNFDLNCKALMLDL